MKKNKKKIKKNNKTLQKKAMLTSIAEVFKPLGINQLEFTDSYGRTKSKINLK